MAFEIHLLMQYAHNQNAPRLQSKEHGVRLMVPAPETGRDVICGAPAVGMIGQCLKRILESVSVAPRLLNAKALNSVITNPDNVGIGSF